MNSWCSRRRFEFLDQLPHRLIDLLGNGVAVKIGYLPCIEKTFTNVPSAKFQVTLPHVAFVVALWIYDTCCVILGEQLKIGYQTFKLTNNWGQITILAYISENCALTPILYLKLVVFERQVWRELVYEPEKGICNF